MTRPARRAGRLLAALALTVPATGALLLGAASPAAAQVVAPGNGTVYERMATVQIRADYEPSGSAHALSVTPPGGGAVQVASAPADRFNGGTMTHGLDLGCWTNSCAPAPNGTWTITQSGGSSGSSTFVVRIAPKAPTGVRAETVGDREVRVRWDLGPEPDLRSWQVLEDGAVVRDGVGTGSCDGGSCSATVSYPSPGSGRHTYAVRALRSDGSGGTLTSEASSTASATLEAAPPSPSPEPDSGSDGGGSDDGGTGGADGGSSGGGTGSGGSGGTAGGGTAGGGTSGSGGTGTPSSGPSPGGGTAAGGSGTTPPDAAPTAADAPVTQEQADQVAVEQRKAFALGFTSFGPKLGIPKLPPLPQAPSVAAPEIADGEFDPTLGFEDQVVREQVESAPASSSRVRSVVDTALDSEQLARSTAGALVLLLAGAHLRRWLGAAVRD